MLVIATSLLLLAASQEAQEARKISDAPAAASAAPAQNPNSYQARKTAKALRSVAAEAATAKLELSELNEPQKALQRLDAASVTLSSVAAPADPASASRRLELAKTLLDLRAAAVAAGAQADPKRAEAWSAVTAIVPAPPEESAPEAVPTIDAEIERQALSGNAEFVTGLGPRAVPGILSALARSEPAYRSAHKDPLCMLMRVDPKAADEYIGKRSASGETDILWDGRLWQAAKEAKIFDQEAAWSYGANGESGEGAEGVPKIELPHTLRECERLLLEPGLTESVAPVFYFIAKRGVCTDPMLAAYARSVDQGELSVASAWMSSLSSVPKARKVLLRAFNSENPELANRASDSLMRAATNEGVYEAVLASTVSQRRSGLNWLSERSTSLPITATRKSHTQALQWTPEYGQAEARFVDALLRDPEAEVRQEALLKLASLGLSYTRESIGGWPGLKIAPITVNRHVPPIPLGGETIRALWADESLEVRRTFVRYAGQILSHQQLCDFARQIPSGDPSLGQEARAALGYLDWHRVPKECLGVLKPLLSSDSDLEACPIFSNFTETGFDALLHSQEGFELAARWAIERNHPRLTRFVAFNERRPATIIQQLQTLPPTVWAQFVAHMMTVPKTGGFGINYKDRLRIAGARSDAAARTASINLAAEGEGLSAVALFGLVTGSPVPEDDRLVAALAALLAAKDWKPGIGSDDSPLARRIDPLLESYTPALRQRVADQLVSRKGLALEKISRCFYGLRSLPLTASAISLAQTNTGQLKHPGSLVFSVLKHMYREPETANVAWIASVTRDDYFAEKGLQAIGKLRSPEFLPLLGEIIEGPASASYYADAVTALQGYLTDEAAGYLLTAARKAADKELRAACLAQVEQIAALEDAERRWSTRNLARVTREATISKLLGLLEDKDDTVRIEAIKGLGTWEAVEAMPELIGLLKDTNPEVSAAAQATLAVLNERERD